MKKKLIIAALVLVVMLVTIYRISVKAPSGIDYSDRAKVASIFIKGDCLSCHLLQAHWHRMAIVLEHCDNSSSRP